MSDNVPEENGEWEKISIDTDHLDDQVDLLYGQYNAQLREIDSFGDLTPDLHANLQMIAEKKLLDEIGRLADRERALARINLLLNRRPVETAEELVARLCPRQGDAMRSNTSNRRPDSVDVETSREEDSTQLDDQVEEEEEVEEAQSESLAMVQLIDLDGEGEVVLDLEVLENLCAQIGDRKLAAISTAGEFRQGKSFWNNVLLGILTNGTASYEPNDWIGGKRGIRFKRGHRRDTKGIMVWPRVFYRNDIHGKEIAVILIDTQGTFDMQAELADSTVIFAISLLMSSVQVCNVKTQLKANDLEALNVFLLYAKKTEEKAGQKLMFLIRDAVGPFGLEAGMEYLQDLEEQSRSSRDISSRLQRVYSTFDQVECHMIPRPAEKVLTADGQIRAKDCGKPFLDGLYASGNHLLNKLEPKTVMGTPLTGPTFKILVQNLVEFVKKNDARDISSALTATSRLYFEKAEKLALRAFTIGLEKFLADKGHRPIPANEFQRTLEQFTAEALEVYDGCQQFAFKETKEADRKSIEATILAICKEKMESNRIRYRDLISAEAVEEACKLYEREMETDVLEALLENEVKRSEHIEARHQTAASNANAHFDQATSQIQEESKFLDTKRQTLQCMILGVYEDLKKANDVQMVKQGIEVFFTQHVERHKNLLEEQLKLIKKEEQVKKTLENIRIVLESEYLTENKKFVEQTACRLPNVDLKGLSSRLDNRRSVCELKLKKNESDFEKECRAKLAESALRQSLETERRRTMSKMRGMEQKLEAAKNTNSGNNMPSIIIMLKKMEEASARQRQEFEAQKTKEERKFQMEQEAEERKRRDEQTAIQKQEAREREERARQERNENERIRREGENQRREDLRKAEEQRRRDELAKEERDRLAVEKATELAQAEMIAKNDFELKKMELQHKINKEALERQDKKDAQERLDRQEALTYERNQAAKVAGDLKAKEERDRLEKKEEEKRVREEKKAEEERLREEKRKKDEEDKELEAQGLVTRLKNFTFGK